MMLGAIFLSNGLLLISMQPNEDCEIKNFDFREDASQVEAMLREDCVELFANQKFNIEKMLSRGTITPQVTSSTNSLTMQVLKYKQSVISFVAFEKLYPKSVIRLLVTAHQERRSGNATKLLTSVLRSLSNKKFTQVIIQTREQNSAAVTFYEKLLRSLNEVSYTKNSILVDGTSIVRYEVMLSKKD